MVERYHTKSNVKLGGFQSQLEESWVSSHTDESWYNETISLWGEYTQPSRNTNA